MRSSDLKRLIDQCDKPYLDSYDILFTLAIALKIGTIFQDDAVVAMNPKYMVIELHADHDGGNPYEAARVAVVRVAKKVLADQEAKGKTNE